MFLARPFDVWVYVVFFVSLGFLPNFISKKNSYSCARLSERRGGQRHAQPPV
jgi:hypothetical protein